MAKSNKDVAEKPAKKKLTGKQKFDKFVMPVLTVGVGILSLATLLGLAGRGLSLYLTDISDDTRIVASVIGVAVLAYAVLTMVKVFDKK